MVKKMTTILLGCMATAAFSLPAFAWNRPAESSKTVKPAAEGSISGVVTFAGTVPARQKIEITKDVNICGKVPHYQTNLVVSDKNKGIANVVVKLTNVRGGQSLAAPGDEFVLDQNGCQFVPRVLVVPEGATLTIKNSDGILHNIHTYSEENQPINKAQPKFLKKITASFDKPEIIRVTCDVHNWMSGYIVVVDNPYYAVTDEAGKFELTDIPPGTYTIEYWHETLGKQTRQITVPEAGTAEANFEFSASATKDSK